MYRGRASKWYLACHQSFTGNRCEEESSWSVSMEFRRGNSAFSRLESKRRCSPSRLVAELSFSGRSFDWTMSNSQTRSDRQKLAGPMRKKEGEEEEEREEKGKGEEERA